MANEEWGIFGTKESIPWENGKTKRSMDFIICRIPFAGLLSQREARERRRQKDEKAKRQTEGIQNYTDDNFFWIFVIIQKK
jgi:hypothetical protein